MEEGAVGGVSDIMAEKPEAGQHVVGQATTVVSFFTCIAVAFLLDLGFGSAYPAQEHTLIAEHKIRMLRNNINIHMQNIMAKRY
jgi:hypothetical protein